MSTVAQPVDIGTLIARTPGIKGGAPHIAGTGVTVKRIALCYKEGLSPEEIGREFEVTVGQVYAALTYYHTNRVEVEAALAAGDADYERYAKEAEAARQSAA